MKKTKVLPILPLRDIVVFPHMVVPLFVGRQKSVKALEEVMENNHKHIILLTQKDSSLDDPSIKDLYTIGTLSKIIQILKLPDGTVKILIEGEERVKVSRLKEEQCLYGKIDKIPDHIADEEELEALQRNVISEFENFIKISSKIPPEVLITIHQIHDASKLADTMASYFNLKIEEKQDLLETGNVNERLTKILSLIESESSALEMEKRIRDRVKKQMEKTQREYYLNEQMKAIQTELHDSEDGTSELTILENRIKNTKLSNEAKEKAETELKKLKTMSPQSSEGTVIRNYLDWLLSIPWNDPSKIKIDLRKAKDVLDEEHYGLEDVKDRILEYLAVQGRVKKMRGQILCLVGPPGVGKTSLGKTIAKVTGRQFTRIALGGVRDESEIRGHRRTYIGSMPGRIIQGMKKAKKSNPLFLLDEIDKLGQDWRGDPSSALLEVLDPEQNSTFNDHYLEVDYDLSDVMFLATANTLKIPQPLLDRMEVIRLPGYTEDEKIHIAKNHLLPKEIKLHGLKPSEIQVPDDSLLQLVQFYTKEAGVRGLDREIAKVCRKAVKDMTLTPQIKTITVDQTKIHDYCGAPKYKYSVVSDTDQLGTTTGLVWTEVGGDILFIEALLIPGSGKISYTGKLGEVMQESIQTAYSFVKSKAKEWAIDDDTLSKKDIHIHVPEGAVPKDGPSAGIAMATSILSALSGKTIKRDVAMTGEITLRGHVLQIGGLKEKLLAAHRGHIKTVIIPKDNEKDLDDIPDVVKNNISIIAVSNVNDVFKVALNP